MIHSPDSDVLRIARQSKSTYLYRDKIRHIPTARQYRHDLTLDLYFYRRAQIECFARDENN